MIKFEEELGHCMVVDELNLYGSTQRGWRLVAIVQEETPTLVPVVNGAEFVRTEGHNTRVTKYVVSLSKDETIKGLAEKLEAADTKSSEQQKIIQKLQNDLADLPHRFQEQVKNSTWISPRRSRLPKMPS